MKLYTQQEIKQFIKQGKITMTLDELILDDNYIDKVTLITSLKKLQTNSKDNFDSMKSDNFMDYKKSCQKSKSKRRKSK